METSPSVSLLISNSMFSPAAFLAWSPGDGLLIGAGVLSDDEVPARVSLHR